jgi:hypothetical protein
VLAQALVAQGQSQEAHLFAQRALEQYAMLRHFRHGMAVALVRGFEGSPHDGIPIPMSMPQKSQSGQ